jgi:hypothetical protein
MDYTDLIKAAVYNDALEVQDHVNAAMGAKVQDAISAMKVDVAQSMFAPEAEEQETDVEVPEPEEVIADDDLDTGLQDLLQDVDVEDTNGI